MIHSKSTKRESEVGFVTKAKRYLLTIEGLPSARVNDFIIDEEGNRGIIRALADDHVVALAFAGDPRPGDRYTYLKDPNLYACGEELFGRIINPLGEPVDGLGALPRGNTPLQLEVDAPGIEVRVPIFDQLQTGITMVDTLIPIARGQRQLLFGPMYSGKTTFLTQTVLEQQKQGVVCIYAIIGKPIVGLRKVADTIMQPENTKTIIIAALSDEPASLVFLAPSVAYMLAEYYRDQGEHVLVILDDLDAHAKYLREIALLEGRLPSTESYPGDVFYQHAHLMERSGHFTEELGGGSITTLPVIQTDFKNFSDLIPTNLMACTDGHLAFLPTLRAEGLYPSISLAESVTRVGRQSQRTVQKLMTTKIQILLGAYRQQQEYAQFSSDLSEQTKEILRKGAIVNALILQKPYDAIPVGVQVLVLALVDTPFFDGKDMEYVNEKAQLIYKALTKESSFAALRKQVLQLESLEAVVEQLTAVLPYLEHYVGDQ